MIRKATTADIDAILKITQACAKHMIANNIFQWNEKYPNRFAFTNDIKQGELYVKTYNAEIIGCITISQIMDDEYKAVQWLTPNTKNLYIHRLAIHPKYQGIGHAKNLMDFAEELAISKNYISIRLDTFSQNKRNQKFYELRGYKKLGNVFFPNQSEHPFYCYELIL